MMAKSYPLCEDCVFEDESLKEDPCRMCNKEFFANRTKPNFVSKMKNPDFNTILADALARNKKITNSDKIRIMTDEEMAELFYLGICVWHFDESVKCKDDGCRKCWLNWLKEEAK